MSKQLFLNNFDTTFIAAVRAAPVTGSPATELDYGVLRISNGAAGALLNPAGGDYYILTAFKRSGTVESNIEIMTVTAVDNSVVGECRITVARAQEGTAAQAYVAGDYLSLRLTKAGAANFLQLGDLSSSNPAALGAAAPGASMKPAREDHVHALPSAAAVGAEPAIAAATGTPTAQYWRGDKNWRDFATDVRAAVLTGLSTVTNAAVAATDTVLVAIGKLQAQLANYLPKSNGSATGLTVDGLNGGQLAGFRNRIINGGFSVWQRGTTFSTTSGNYTADRWLAYFGGTSLTVDRVAVTTPDKPSGTQYGLRATGAAGNTFFIPQYRMESLDAQYLAGKTIAYSYWVYQDTGATITCTTGPSYPNTIDNFSATTPIASPTQVSVPSGSWTKVAGTVSVPLAATTGLQFNLLSQGTPVLAGKQMIVTDFQVELGTVATPFEFRPYGTELALCQRYYFKTFSQGVTPAQNTGDFTGALAAFGSPSLIPTTYLSFPVEMRASPTVALYTARSSGATGQWSELSTGALANARTFYTGTRGCTIDNSGTFPPNGIVYSIHATASAEL